MHCFLLPRTLFSQSLALNLKSRIIKGPRFQSITQSSSPPLPHHYHFDLFFFFFFPLASTYHHLRIMFVCLLSVCHGPGSVSRARLLSIS